MTLNQERIETQLRAGKLLSPYDLIGLEIAGAAAQDGQIYLYLKNGPMDLWLAAWRDEEQNGPGALFLHTADGRGGESLVWTDTNNG